jgi:DNA-binding SARP family transcriptional activator
MAVEIRLLGGLEVRLDGVPLDLGTQRARCVLAALLVHHGRTVSSGDLARRAWPGEPPATAEQQVRNYVGQLRRGPLASVAEQLRLQTRRPGYRAELAPGILDIDCFDDLLKRAKRAADTAEPNAAALFREALGLCRGRALDGLDTEYLQARAAILEDRRRDATLAFAELEASAGHYAEAAQALRDLAADRPDDAALHAAYLRAETRQAEEAERPAPPSAHKPLPTDTNAFTGRTAEVEDLLARAAEAGAERSPGATVVCAVDGMAGTGKTALAIHLAHQVAADFRDGQLFIDLHGYTQGLAPRDPKDALAALLQQLGVTSQECPDDLEGRAALYRARLADTATLILLDNALDEAQVAPLIPASEKSMVLITSRARLAALDDAWALSLEGLSVPDSIALFHKIAGPDRAATGGRELIDIVEHCAGLPLAVRIVAALFRNRRWTPAMLLERIGTLDGFSDGSRDLSSLFALSYETLDEPCRILFRLLGVMPGPDIEAQAAAALYAEKDVGALARRLERLADQNLVVERADGRYGMHDLVRLYARKLAAGDAEADTARGRLLDYYQEASDRANAQWLEQPEHARQWLRAERANLEACLMLAAELGQDDRVVALARGLSKILRMDGPWARAREIHTQVLAAARRAGDPRGEAEVLVRFGDIQRVSGGIEIARTALTEALEIYRGLDDHDGIHAALYRLGQVGLSCGDHCYAERYLREAVETEFRLSDPRGKSFAIVSLGDVCMRTGRSEEAERYYRQALATYRAVGSQTG